MFSIKHIKDPILNVDFLELKNSYNSSYAKIDLNFGGSLQKLTLLGKEIISSENMTPYHDSFTSSVLFPFTNRIENGCYFFNKKKFDLEKNEAKRNNAIHGLVFNKQFKIVEQNKTFNKASIVLSYIETEPVSGFPFKYEIKLKYMLTENALELHVEVKNNDNESFPFSLGWHPYFKTNGLHNSYLTISSLKKIQVNDKMIPIGETEVDWNGPLKIEENTFDDCFILNTNKLEFKTPEYHLDFNFSTKENYLQLYTPKHRKSIAIEPQTAPANSFNSKMGLQVLKPNDTYKLSWKIKLK